VSAEHLGGWWTFYTSSALIRFNALSKTWSGGLQGQEGYKQRSRRTNH